MEIPNSKIKEQDKKNKKTKTKKQKIPDISQKSSQIKIRNKGGIV